MSNFPICFHGDGHPIRFERTDIGALSADYCLVREENRSYSVSVYCNGRHERLAAFTSRRLVAEAFYLLSRTQGVLPSGLTDLWQEFAEGLVSG